jgi:hypothetical protein
MKLKFALPMIAALAGLSLLPIRSVASTNSTPVAPSATNPEDYGAAYTSTFGGTVMVCEQNGQIGCWGFQFAGMLSNNSVWNLAEYGVNSIHNYLDASKNVHSDVVALTAFTGGSYNAEPSLATLSIVKLANGSETLSLKIVDYYNQSITLFDSKGAQPVTTGTIGIY